MLVEVLEDPSVPPLLEQSSIDLKEMCKTFTSALLRHSLSPTCSSESLQTDLIATSLVSLITTIGSAISFSSEAMELRESILECTGPNNKDILSFSTHLLQALHQKSEANTDMVMLLEINRDDRNELVKATLCLITNLLYRCRSAQVFHPIAPSYII